jgi:hypothetical protein
MKFKHFALSIKPENWVENKTIPFKGVYFVRSIPRGISVHNRNNRIE